MAFPYQSSWFPEENRPIDVNAALAEERASRTAEPLETRRLPDDEPTAATIFTDAERATLEQLQRKKDLASLEERHQEAAMLSEMALGTERAQQRHENQQRFIADVSLDSDVGRAILLLAHELKQEGNPLATVFERLRELINNQRGPNWRAAIQRLAESTITE